MSVAQAAPAAPGPRRWSPAGALQVGAARMANYGVFLAVVLALWLAAIGLFRIPPYLLPNPAQTWAAFVANGGEIGAAAAFTVGCTIAGMSVSVVIAMALAVLFTLSRPLDKALTPLLIVVRTVPVIAIAPLLILIWGRGQWNTIGVVALLTFFQIMLAAKRGFQAPTANVMEMMRANGASFWQIMTKVRIPFAAPYIFTGLRLAAHSAILSAMFAEWLSGAPGLGNLMLDAYSQQQFALMWSAIIVSTTVAYLFFTVTIMLERAVADRSA
jgi:ABC-type nitrate/sulfonate/bicarbonate transport system permease component